MLTAESDTEFCLFHDLELEHICENPDGCKNKAAWLLSCNYCDHAPLICERCLGDALDPDWAATYCLGCGEERENLFDLFTPIRIRKSDET